MAKGNGSNPASQGCPAVALYGIFRRCVFGILVYAVVEKLKTWEKSLSSTSDYLNIWEF